MSWICSICGTSNDDSLTNCFVCDAEHDTSVTVTEFRFEEEIVRESEAEERARAAEAERVAEEEREREAARARERERAAYEARLREEAARRERERLARERADRERLAREEAARAARAREEAERRRITEERDRIASRVFLIGRIAVILPIVAFVAAMAVSLVLLGTRGELGLVLDRLLDIFSTLWQGIADSFTVGWATVLGALFLDNPFNGGVLGEMWSGITEKLSFGFGEVLPLMLSSVWMALCALGVNIAEMFVRIGHGIRDMWRAFLMTFGGVGTRFSDLGDKFSAIVDKISESIRALKQ